MGVLLGPILFVTWATQVQPELDRQIREHRKEREAAAG